jgi:hypothetical protein
MMANHAKASFTITSWEQTPYDEQDQSPTLSRATVKKSFQGDITATSTAALLMCQAADGAAGYVATERVTGQIGERDGSFVIQHGGTLAPESEPHAFGYIVPSSGTGALQGLRGACRFHHDEQGATFILDYDIA